MQALCEKYGLEYNTGPLHKQLGSVAAKIFRLALPPRRKAAAGDSESGTPEQVTGFPVPRVSVSDRFEEFATDRTAEPIGA